MTELTLKELQNEELKILKDVHQFCKKNNLRYSLYGGTLIGALRHKGFIPWDDDIDIIMPRPDYDRFCREFQSENYKVADMRKEKQYMLGFARVYDEQRTVMTSTVPWISKEVGVWIDIFPADGLPNDKNEIELIYKKAIQLRKKMLFARGATVKLSTRETLKGKVMLLAKKAMTLNGNIARIYVKELDKLMRMYDFESSPMWGSLSNIRGMYEHKHHSIDTFRTCVEVDFEDMKALAMNGSDAMLRERNGNYMQLPPESERIPKQGYIHFYWKNR